MVVGRLFALGAACHQITFIVVESWLFKGTRDWCAGRNEHLGKLVSCHLCFGTWVGLILSALFRPRVAPPSGFVQGPVRAFVGWAVDGFVIALIGRVMNEVIGTVRKEVEVKEKEAELLEATVESVEREPQSRG